jgi:hypothetical protein
MIYTRLSFYVASLTVLAATAGPAVYFRHQQGFQADAIEQAAGRLLKIPSHFGQWHLRDEEPLPDSTLRMLQCKSHVNRTYTNDVTGQSVSLTLLVGPAGPLLAHTPEVCMTSREYEPLKNAAAVPLTDRKEDHFYAAPFRAKTLDGHKLNVYYAWSRDGKRWEAPETPRLTLGPLPMLYKVQVASVVPALSEAPEQDAALAFLGELLPRIANEPKSDTSVVRP